MKNNISDLDLYQKDSNSLWFTDLPIYCEHTGKQIKKGYNISLPDKTDLGIYSFEHYVELSYKLWSKHEFYYMRLIESNSIATTKTVKKERSEMTLKLRYEVLKRDKFRCVKCGNDALKSTLEIDHILPVSKGGKSIISNLETLCYECNHGKGSSI